MKYALLLIPFFAGCAGFGEAIAPITAAVVQDVAAEAAKHAVAGGNWDSGTLLALVGTAVASICAAIKGTNMIRNKARTKRGEPTG